MKKEWINPLTIVQKFVANEYIAACGDSNKVYKFECDARGGALYYYPNSDGTIDGEYNGSDESSLLGYLYSPCGEQHEASSTDDFYDGYVEYTDTEWNGFIPTHTTKRINVIVWRGPNNNNGHATKNLDMSSWQTAKS